METRLPSFDPFRHKGKPVPQNRALRHLAGEPIQSLKARLCLGVGILPMARISLQLD